MAASKISVELLQDIAHMGRKWEVIEVSTAQARNFLIPKKMAKELTEELMKKRENDEKRAKDQARMRLEQAYEIQKLLDGKEVDMKLKGKNGKIFWGISEHEVIAKIKNTWQIDFEKKDVKLPNKTHIKTLGSHMVYLHITHDTLAKIFVNVTIDE